MGRKAIDKGKALIQSKVFWFNLLSLLVAVASLFGFAEFEPDVEVTKVIAVVNTIGNIFLRFKTSQPITRIK